MPSLQQINTAQSSETPKQSKKAVLKKYLKIIAGIAIVWLGYTYFTAAKVISIPDDAYSMRDKSMFKDLFSDQYKKVIWFGANCPVSRQRKKIFDMVMTAAKLNNYYIHRPFLQNKTYVAPGDILGHFVMQNCFASVCIIVPSSHKIIQTTEKHLLRDLNKYKMLQ
ncbi:MAG: hypothetical protein J6N49_02060 [Alphaproteobacteria bacterium]|nr:hypothetical protein [Alphaproteobacteria bacterium]